MNRVANISDTNRRVYAAMVTALDDGVGQVLQTLQAQNLLDKTGQKALPATRVTCAS